MNNQLNHYECIVDFSEIGIKNLIKELNEIMKEDMSYVKYNKEAKSAYLDAFIHTYSESYHESLEIEIKSRDSKTGTPHLLKLNKEDFEWETIEEYESEDE